MIRVSFSLFWMLGLSKSEVLCEAGLWTVSVSVSVSVSASVTILLSLVESHNNWPHALVARSASVVTRHQQSASLPCDGICKECAAGMRQAAGAKTSSSALLLAASSVFASVQAAGLGVR